MGKKQELRPCPFCGERAIAITVQNALGGKWPAVICTGCEARTLLASSPERAAEAWNRRSSSDEAEVVGWQPIETAPKDGRELLIFNRVSRVGFWDSARGGCWSIWPGRSLAEHATHWRPLPTPPIQGEAK